VLVADSPVPNLAPPPDFDYPVTVAPSFFPRSAFGSHRNVGYSHDGMPDFQGGFAGGPADAAAPRQPAPPLKVVGQLKLTYIVAEGPAGMFLVDQHAAHERVLFDRISQKPTEREPQSQPLLEPVSVELSPSQGDTLQSNRESLEDYGFQFEPFGDGSYLLRAVPAIFGETDPAKSLLDVLDMTAFEGLVRQKDVPRGHQGGEVVDRARDGCPAGTTGGHAQPPYLPPRTAHHGPLQFQPYGTGVRPALGFGSLQGLPVAAPLGPHNTAKPGGVADSHWDVSGLGLVHHAAPDPDRLVRVVVKRKGPLSLGYLGRVMEHIP